MTTRWEPSWHRAERRSVEGGVVVAKPGRVTHPDAVALLEQAEIETDSRMLSRGRTYARAGQVVSVVAEPGRFTARIQGSRSRPYEVALERIVISGSDRVAATCSCPYGCDYQWCKHAAALSYVAAFLLERDAGVRAVWSAEPDSSGDPAAALDEGAYGDLDPTAEIESAVLSALAQPVPVLDVLAMLHAASDIVPHPRWRPAE